MNKTYLTLEEVQNLFAGRMGDYGQKINGQENVLSSLTTGLHKLVELRQEEKIAIYQVEVEGKKHTFIEFTEGKVSEEEITELRKIADFLVKIETQLGYNML